MAKVNINSATREELVDVVGLRPDVADEILKFRRKGKIASVEALGEIQGVGPATLDQLRKALDFSEQATSETAHGAAEAADNVTELGKRAADQVAETGRRVAERADETVRSSVKVAQRAAGMVSEVPREVAAMISALLKVARVRARSVTVPNASSVPAFEPPSTTRRSGSSK